MKITKLLFALMVLGSMPVFGMDDQQSDDDEEFHDALDYEPENPPQTDNKLSISGFWPSPVVGLSISGGVLFGTRHIIMHSSIKQSADLMKLEKRCDQAIHGVRQKKTIKEIESVESVTCVSLGHDMQDQLDSTIALYALAIQELRAAIKANRLAELTALPEYQAAQHKLAICKEVIARCNTDLANHPSWADRALQAGVRHYRAGINGCKSLAIRLMAKLQWRAAAPQQGDKAPTI